MIGNKKGHIFICQVQSKGMNDEKDGGLYPEGPNYYEDKGGPWL